MQRSIHRYWLAFYQETTPCLAPGNWVADGTAIECVSVDLSGVKQDILDNPTLERRAMSTNKRDKIKGLRNNTSTFGLKLHGTGVETADTDTVVETYLGTILKHCTGGLYLGTSSTCTAGTATIPILANVDDLIPGCMIAFQDTTAPTSKNAGKLHPRRVLAINTDTKAVTLSEALPFTPANGDKAHGVELNYIDEAFLEDAVAGGGTMMWYVQRAKSDTNFVWQQEGSVASFQLQNLSRGQLPTIELAVMAANFRHGADDGLTYHAFDAPEGHAQLACGKDIQCSIAAYGNTAASYVDVNQVGFDVGFTRERVETTTENIDRFEGTASYTFKPGNTRFTVTLPQYANSWYASLQDVDHFRITFYQPGDGSGAGKGWCLHIAKAQLVETPGRVDVNENHGVSLTFEAQEPDDATVAANEELEKSVFLICRF